jgi:iron-sulfur cluster repair protein YtfE (RIC family)
MNAIDLLKEDHDRVDKLFQKVLATNEGEEHAALFEQIKQELDVHTRIEEALLYPKLKEEGDEKLYKLAVEAFEEHHQAKIFLRELDSLKTVGEKFEAKLKVLMEDIKHHVQEEEGQMFPLIKEQFDEYTLQTLGNELENEKQKFQKSHTARSGRS